MIRLIPILLALAITGCASGGPKFKGPKRDWRAAINQQMFFFGSPTYFFRDVENPKGWIIEILNAGLTGPDIELNGPFPVYEYNGQRIRNLDVASECKKSIDAMEKWLIAARTYGAVISLKFLNSNQSDANRMPDSWWEETAYQFIKRYGSDNLLIMPLNEADGRTRASIGTAIRRGLSRAGFPTSQMIDWNRDGSSGYWEVHPRDDKVRRGNHKLLQISDSGEAIRFLYGNDWQQGGTPNVDRIKSYTRNVKRAGTSGGIYSFARKPDRVGLKAAGEAWRE